MDEYQINRDFDAKSPTCFLHVGELEKLHGKIDRLQTELYDLRQLVVGVKPQEKNGLRGEFLAFKSKLNFIASVMGVTFLLYAPEKFIEVLKLLHFMP